MKIYKSWRFVWFDFWKLYPRYSKVDSDFGPPVHFIYFGPFQFWWFKGNE